MSSDDGAVFAWPAPAPLTGSAERIDLWLQVITGLLPDGGAVRVLWPQEWEDRARRLREAGGPPRGPVAGPHGGVVHRPGTLPLKAGSAGG